MNSKISKELRELCKPVDSVSRRVYRRLKKQYKKLPRHARRDFIDLLKETNLKMDAE
tara:strand:- start:868 stop:1038 length:171 start_codon:yes stop_codon:yes gene_type:complete